MNEATEQTKAPAPGEIFQVNILWRGSGGELKPTILKFLDQQTVLRIEAEWIFERLSRQRHRRQPGDGESL